MAKNLEKYDPYSASPEELLEPVRETATELSMSGLKVVASSTGVPMRELARLYEEGRIEQRYLPVLYTHFFGNVTPERTKQFRVDHGL